MVLTEAQQTKLNDIKRRALAKEFVSREEKAWVLDVVRLTGRPIPAQALAGAQREGFDTSGITALQ